MPLLSCRTTRGVGTPAAWAAAVTLTVRSTRGAPRGGIFNRNRPASVATSQVMLA